MQLRSFVYSKSNSLSCKSANFLFFVFFSINKKIEISTILSSNKIEKDVIAKTKNKKLQHSTQKIKIKKSFFFSKTTTNSTCARLCIHNDLVAIKNVNEKNQQNHC